MNWLTLAASLVRTLTPKKSQIAVFWQKRKVRESIPEDVLENMTIRPGTNDKDSNDTDKSFGSSTETCSTQLSSPAVRKKKLNWVVNMIVETIEETVECEPVTIKIKTPKVRTQKSSCPVPFQPKPNNLLTSRR